MTQPARTLEQSVYDTPGPSLPPSQPAAAPPSPAAEPAGPAAFDPRWREEFTGLLYIGALTDTFTWLGHTFVIRTLSTDDLAEVALVVKRYEQTDAAMKVYQAGVVAAAVISVDGVPLPTPITTDPADTPFLNRFRYVMRNWFSPVLDAVYERYFRLELTVREVIDAMGNPAG